MILSNWQKLSRYPLGKSLFNWFFWLMVPYTGSIRPEVLELEPGHAKVRMRDRKRLRNHLHSIHAAALMNLAEATSGLAFICGLPKNTRGIVTDFSVEYKKKARGTLIGECHCIPPKTNEKQGFKVEAIIRDEEQDIVAIGHATWLISPIKL